MSSGRRTIDRRRRVLYSAGRDEPIRPTAASRRETQRLREARRPVEAYGARVHRRLEGRWFSLVPVRRRTMTSVASVLLGIAALLCAAHYAAYTWPSLAYNEAVSRPLRLDRPDSFGRLFTIAMLAACAGASLLIYQLRRYRNDDYQGRYRLWRLVLVVMLMASINSLVSLIDWGGALLDAAFGKRVALAGADWLQIVVSIGGTILALRLLAEMRRCRFALATMALCCATLAIEQAARWNVLEVNTMSIGIAVTSAPMVAFTLLFVSFGAYLRMLYREVRDIEESDSLRNRFQQMRLKLFQRPEDESEQQDDSDEIESPKRRWWGGRSSAAEPDVAQEETAKERVEPEQQPAAKQEPEPAQEAPGEEQELEDHTPTRKRKGWFGRRRRKAAEDSVDSEVEANNEETSTAEDEPAAPKKKRRGWSLRLPPQSETTDEETAIDPEPDSEAVPKERRGWFGRKKKAAADEAASSEESPSEPESQAEPKERRGWFGRKKKVAADETASDAEMPEESPSPAEPTPTSQDEEYIDENEIDWNSLNKTERRRLRKQLKRQNRAA